MCMIDILFSAWSKVCMIDIFFSAWSKLLMSGLRSKVCRLLGVILSTLHGLKCVRFLGVILSILHGPKCVYNWLNDIFYSVWSKRVRSLGDIFLLCIVQSV